MNVKRFTARTSREALRLVREALGDDAVVLSTKPSASGVEVLAMAPDGLQQVERMADKPMPPIKGSSTSVATTATPASSVEQDADRLAMSTLSFQDYVRNRMLKRRKAAIEADAAPAPAAEANYPQEREREGGKNIYVRIDDAMTFADTLGEEETAVPATEAATEAAPERFAAAPHRTAAPFALSADDGWTDDTPPPGRRFDAPSEHHDLLAELRSMKGLIEERFGALAFMEKLQRRPGEARLTQKLLDCGFSPALIRKLADGLTPESGDEAAWAAQVLERNLQAGEATTPLEDQGGTFALVGATGVGKTTTTAKIAAAFAARHGAANLGLVTLDAYRVGAHEQLRAYGRILGVPVHTAHDRLSLEDLLDLLSAKKMVLIDTAGMAQRDTRTRELLDMLAHRSIQRLLVVNAASQGETIEDVLAAYRAASCAGVVLSKIDEAVKLGPALDAAIRHKLKIVGVANGQRVPEDWHRLSANALVQRALRAGGSAAWRFDASDMNLVFAASRGVPAHGGGSLLAH